LEWQIKESMVSLFRTFVNLSAVVKTENFIDPSQNSIVTFKDVIKYESVGISKGRNSEILPQKKKITHSNNLPRKISQNVRLLMQNIITTV
jgi:hypothetical protein